VSFADVTVDSGWESSQITITCPESRDASGWCSAPSNEETVRIREESTRHAEAGLSGAALPTWCRRLRAGHQIHVDRAPFDEILPGIDAAKNRKAGERNQERAVEKDPPGQTANALSV
jgi:hypothetical protein